MHLQMVPPSPLAHRWTFAGQWGHVSCDQSKKLDRGEEALLGAGLAMRIVPSRIAESTAQNAAPGSLCPPASIEAFEVSRPRGVLRRHPRGAAPQPSPSL